MSIRAVARQPAPEPKALCASCGRPMAVLKAVSCVYCGATNPDGVEAVSPVARMAPELVLAMEPNRRVLSTRSRWIRRGIALGAAAILVALFMGSCMQQS